MRDAMQAKRRGPAPNPRALHRGRTLLVALQPEDYERLAAAARAANMRPTTFARELLLRELNGEGGRGSDPARIIFQTPSMRHRRAA